MQQEMHSKAPTQMKKEANRSISMSPFDLIAYEYQIPKNNKHKDKEGDENNKDDDKDDTDDDDFLALPSTIARSKQEVGPSDPDDCNYILPPNLLDRIGKAFSDFKLHGKSKRKRDKEDKQRMKEAKLSGGVNDKARDIEKDGENKAKKMPIVDTVGDIFADMGEYDPNSALERAAKKNLDASDKMDIFVGLRAESTEEIVHREKEKNVIDDADKMIKKFSTTSSSSSSAVKEDKPLNKTLIKEDNKIHRDIIGGESKKKEKEKKGNAFLKGSYDGNDFANPYDDDDLDDGGNDSDDERAVSTRPKTVQEVMDGEKDTKW